MYLCIVSKLEECDFKLKFMYNIISPLPIVSEIKFQKINSTILDDIDGIFFYHYFLLLESELIFFSNY